VVSAKGQQFIIDSLRYWLEDMRVDGFRFDLSSILGNKMEHGGFEYTRDGLLTRIYKEFPQAVLIAEPWAIGDGHYQVGNHPGSIVQGDNAWSEWNDKYRTTIRQAVKGDSGVVRDLATRIAGSSDLYEDDERRPFNSINYVVSHDGYTLHDLVSFNSNDSWDSGGDEAVRRKQMRNFFTHLLLSAGTPMILGGDEMSRTQHGNAGAYNQDNLVSWYDWNDMSRNRGMYQFVKTLVHLRNNHPVLKRMDFFNGADNNGDGVQNIEWHGTVYKQPDWAPTSRVLAWRLDGSTVETKAPADNDFYVMVNHSHLELLFHYHKAHSKELIH
jgi:glycogen operon protein